MKKKKKNTFLSTVYQTSTNAITSCKFQHNSSHQARSWDVSRLTHKKSIVEGLLANVHAYMFYVINIDSRLGWPAAAHTVLKECRIQHLGNNTDGDENADISQVRGLSNWDILQLSCTHTRNAPGTSVNRTKVFSVCRFSCMFCWRHPMWEHLCFKNGNVGV